MKSFFEVKWLITGFSFSLSFFLSLLLFTYKSIPWPYLSQGTFPDNQFFHPSLEELYLWGLAIAFFYHTSVLYLRGRMLPSSVAKNQTGFLSGWFFDSLFLYGLFCYFVVINYLGYFNQHTWIKEKIIYFFLIINPVFYGSLWLHILLNFFIYSFFNNSLKKLR